MRTINLFLLCAFLSLNESTENHSRVSEEKPFLVKSINEKHGLPKETQMAQCTVQSGDIKASAQATFSKKLEGFCSSDDMIELRHTLVAMERRIFHNIYNLKLMMERALPESYMHGDNFLYPSDYVPKKEKKEEGHDINYTKTYRPPEVETSTKGSLIDTTTDFPATYETSSKIPQVVKNKLKSLDTSKNRRTATEMPVTESEVVHKNEYIYYWKLDNFPQVFRYAKKNELFSHVFSVKGLFLRIQGMLNFLENENLFFDIEHLANVAASDMGIDINDGLVFKEIAEEKLFQYSFAVMDQTRPNRDLISPVYWNTDTDKFMIPNCIHVLSNYLKDDSLLIKLQISF